MQTYLVYSLILLGIFLPSSTNGIYIGVSYNIISFTFAMIILILSMKGVNFIRSILVIAILIFLIINTLLTDSIQYQPGTLLVILPLLFYFSIDLKEIDIKLFMKFLNFISVILFILGLSVIFDVSIIDDFLGHHYVGTYTDLYMYMLNANRPVGPFGAHSVAAFIYFLFFIFYYVSWLDTKQSKYLIFSMFYILLILALKSFSALFFIVFAFFTILNSKFLLNRINILFFLFNIVIVCIAYILLSSFMDVQGLLVGTEANGLLSRYGDNGILVHNIQYLKDNLFMGDGIGYSENLYYTDSGYIRTLLTYGITGTITFYITFAMIILKKNYTYLFILLFACLFFDIGYDIFFYHRYIFILVLMSFFITNVTLTKKEIKK